MGGVIGGLWSAILAYCNKINNEDANENEDEIDTCIGDVEDDCRAIDLFMISMLIISVIFIVSIVFIVFTL